MLILHCTYN